MDSNVPASAWPSETTTVMPASGWRTRRLCALRSDEPAEHTARVVSMSWTRRSSSAERGNRSASGQSVRCTERPPVSPRQISSLISGSSGADIRVVASSTVHRTSKASRSSSKNRSRLRRTYQLVTSSM